MNRLGDVSGMNAIVVTDVAIMIFERHNVSQELVGLNFEFTEHVSFLKERRKESDRLERIHKPPSLLTLHIVYITQVRGRLLLSFATLKTSTPPHMSIFLSSCAKEKIKTFRKGVCKNVQTCSTLIVQLNSPHNTK